MGSGTVSGNSAESYGSLLEMTRNGASPLTLSAGEQRTFLEDDDSVWLRGWGQGEGYRVGFGLCEGTVMPAMAIRREEAGVGR